MSRNLTGIERKRRLKKVEQEKKWREQYRKGIGVRKSSGYIQENPYM